MRHPGESRDLRSRRLSDLPEVPAFAGMTRYLLSLALSTMRSNSGSPASK